MLHSLYCYSSPWSYQDNRVGDWQQSHNPCIQSARTIRGSGIVILKTISFQDRFIMLQLDLLQIQIPFECLRTKFHAGYNAPKEDPKLTLFTLKLAFVGKLNSNCVLGLKSDCAVRCKVQCCSYVAMIRAIRCETAEKSAKNCVFGPIIENKTVRAQK